LLAGCRLRRQELYNVYYDTPDHLLLRQGVVLRLRRVGLGARPVWIQTLKTGGGAASALSRRGEWEAPLASPQLSLAALDGSPWGDIDRQGDVFAELRACFRTEFTRARWMLPLPAGNLVEVALDLGRIVVGDQAVPIRELELELKAGHASSLFDAALQIARVLPVIPCSTSKAERGYAISGATQLPGTGESQRMKPTRVVSPAVLATAALQSAMRQFTTHLMALRHDGDPELVHQARVAWRRFRSARRLFGACLAPLAFPDARAAMQPLLLALGQVRDLDVARTLWLPRLAPTYIGADPGRARKWERMLLHLQAQGAQVRHTLHAAIDDPATGQALLSIAKWLDALGTTPCGPDTAPSPRRTADARAWALRQIRRQGRKLRAARKAAGDGTDQHHLRILAKRLHYGVDTLQLLLPEHQALRWHRLATRLQAEIGARRDATQAAALVQGLEQHAHIAAFLRGYVAGLEQAAPFGPAC
jgi:inorganic triphosphatase YgiF